MFTRLFRWATFSLAVAIFLVVLLLVMKQAQPVGGDDPTNDVQSFVQSSG